MNIWINIIFKNVWTISKCCKFYRNYNKELQTKLFLQDG